MKTKLIIGVLLLSAALLIIPAAADDSASAPTLPYQVYGSVCFSDGENLPAGTVITATVDGVTSTFTVTEPGKIGGAGTFDDKFLINGTTNGSAVTFSINGLPAAVTGGCTFSSGEGKQVALTMEKIEAAVNADNGSKSIFKEDPVIVGASGFVPDNFTLTIREVSTAETPAKPKNTEVFKAIEITPSQQGVSVLIPITISDAELKEHFNNNRSTVAVYHHNGTLWEKIPVRNFDIKTGGTVFWIQADSFSPYIIVSEAAGAEPTASPITSPTVTPTATPAATVTPVATATPTATAAPAATPTPAPKTQTPAPVAGDVPPVKSGDLTTPATQSKSPVPLPGILAGLGAAALLFAVRQRR